MNLGIPFSKSNQILMTGFDFNILYLQALVNRNAGVIVIREIFLIVVLIVSIQSSLFSQKNVSNSLEHSKIASSIRKGEIESVRVLVSDTSTFIQWMKIRFSDVKIEKEKLPNVYRVHVNRLKDVEKLAGFSSVQFIDRGNRLPKEEKALGVFDLTLNNILAAQNQYDVTGLNLVASIKEKPFDYEDIDLKNRTILNEQFDEPPTLHATSMATIIAGAGNSEPSGTGVAQGARVTTSDFFQLLPDDGNSFVNLGVSVQNHSYGVGVENYYGIESAAYDDHCNDFSTIMHVFSSGNEGDKLGANAYASIPGFANLTGQFKVSKNTISVGSADATGNVVVKSSRGPTYDGRIKPEIIAYGDAGSSDAAAVVSGIALLAQQKYRDQTGSMPPSSFVKAVLINSAHDVGRPNVDFDAGFGNADALRALKTIHQQNYFIEDISGGEEKEFNITVPINSYKLKVTVVWNDASASPNATTALINDLDLEVRHVASGNRWKPWVLSHYPHRDSLLLPAKRKSDHLNNVEQVTVDLPEGGDYAITIRGYHVPQGAQSFSIVYETESGFEWTNPTEGNSFTANRSNFVRWRWNQLPAIGRLEYKSIDKTRWIEISNSVDLSSQYFQWLTPDSTLHIQLRMTVGSTAYESEIFTVVKPIALKVGYNCDEETLLMWSGDDKADQYQVFRMGGNYLEPFLLTADTFAILNTGDKAILEYSVSPVIGGMTGQKGTTIDYTSMGVSCYFVNFLPRQYVVIDEVIFDLTVGTTHKLHSVIFERFSKGGPVEIQKINPTGTNILLKDINPEPGLNQYRVRLENDNFESVYVSGYEEILFVRDQDLIVFPNPIAQGEELNIVANDLDTAHLRVYDAMGRIIEEITDEGTIKTIDTTRLIRGVYIIEFLKTNGSRLTARLLVF